ncbi:queuosine precursor transporter [Pseudomonas violetae]|jgi:queuosine precursor transporter|uniref:Probable queuosine precursor transporter n=1 Tax=Pseudomonas violetae TaxID=2915813 RepID=A0ABT0F5E1_9PSED|nr:queuosine precursor transporter [Pseudomonas violetae]MCK1793153.1 queuosine precursor transporter [Pseudomonas violetae]
MTNKDEIDNNKYKLLGFENDRKLAIIMIISTGKIIKIPLKELITNEIIDNLNKAEIKTIYRKFYSHGTAPSAYEVNDRHESAWIVFAALNLLLFSLYIFTNFSAAKLFYLGQFDIIVTPGVFLYPLTFLVVDLLNEFYGFRLARKAILFAFVSNGFIFSLLSATSYFPGLPGWQLDNTYSELVNHVTSVLVASSVSFLFSEYANSYLLCKIKELTNSKFLFIRVFLSTFFAVVIDSFLFCFIAFYGTMRDSEIMHMIFVQIAIKMCFAVFNILPAYGARALFKKHINQLRSA